MKTITISFFPFQKKQNLKKRAISRDKKALVSKTKPFYAPVS